LYIKGGLKIMNDIYVKAAPSPSLFLLVGSNGKEILRFEKNGDIFLRGMLTDNGKQVVDGFRDFLYGKGLLTRSEY
jgi:hypothetical protein